MQTIRNCGCDIVLLVALLVVASMFIGVYCYHAYGTYAEIHTGKDLGPVRPHRGDWRGVAGDRHLAAHRSDRHPLRSRPCPSISMSARTARVLPAAPA